MGVSARHAPQPNRKNDAFQSHTVLFNKIKDLRVSEQVCICPPTCRPFTAHFPLYLPGQQPLHASGREWEKPSFPCVKHQPSAVLLTARMSNICQTSLGTCEGQYPTAERAQDICIQHLHEHKRHHYSANIVRELQDNEAKFKLCMVC